MLYSICVGPKGKVIAFEPMPRNLGYLYRHLELNGVDNVTIMEGVVFDREGEVRITGNLDSAQNRVDPEGEHPVRSFVLDHLVYREGFSPPDAIKVDVEGAEAAVLRGGARLLTERRPLIFLSTHNSQVHAGCCRFLKDLGYKLCPIGSGSIDDCSELLGEG